MKKKIANCYHNNLFIFSAAIEAPPVPVLSQINKTSVFAYLEMMNINKEANTTYSFGLVVKNCSKV